MTPSQLKMSAWAVVLFWAEVAALPFSMECWMATPGPERAATQFPDPRLDNIIFINGAAENSSVDLFDGICHNVVLTYEPAGRVNIYVDGLLFRIADGTGNAGLNGAAWRVGGSEDAANVFFSSCAVWPVLLSSQRVLEHYDWARCHR
jgi:hypothetical protein